MASLDRSGGAIARMDTRIHFGKPTDTIFFCFKAKIILSAAFLRKEIQQRKPAKRAAKRASEESQQREPAKRVGKES